ncbi:MAG TPA: ECF transporter S component [Firmicutes bacterium]|nr:ECF transporter S component [Bacillota bacterium]
MQEEKGLKKQEETWQKSLRWLTRTAVLLALTLAFQMLGLPQPVTGPAVNAMLLLSAIFVGALGGAVIGLFTPWIAFIRGILAAPLGPMIPFIMIGNAALVLVFSAVRNAGRKALWAGVTGVVAGAVVKFLILSSAVRYVVEVKPPIARAMQLPQLFTALTGGVIALAVAGAIQAAVRSRRD